MILPHCQTWKDDIMDKNFHVFLLDDAEQWDRIVRSFCNYEVYYLSEYTRAFEIHGDGQPLLFYYDDSYVRGINVVMKRDISLETHFRGKLAENTYFDITSPYGYGGWLIEGGAPDMLFQAYSEWCCNHDIVCEFARFHPVLENHKKCWGAYEVAGLGKTVVMDLSSPQCIWENITSKNRNVIRKAIRNEIKIYNGRYPDIFEKFRYIYNRTMDQDGAESYYYFEPEFYDSVLKGLEQNVQIFYAQLPNGEIIAAAIMLIANGYMNYHLSGSLREYSSLAATNLLLYKAALWGCENGCRTLYLGGGVGTREDGLFRFKKSFYKGELRRFYLGKKVFNNGVYQMLVKIRENNIRNEDYFPLYRG